MYSIFGKPVLCVSTCQRSLAGRAPCRTQDLPARASRQPARWPIGATESASQPAPGATSWFLLNRKVLVSFATCDRASTVGITVGIKVYRHHAACADRGAAPGLLMVAGVEGRHGQALSRSPTRYDRAHPRRPPAAPATHAATATHATSVTCRAQGTRRHHLLLDHQIADHRDG